MKRKTILTVGLLLMLLVLAACSGSAPATSTQSQETNQTTGSESPQGTGTAFDPGEVSTDMKLALGTLQLEDTDLAVTAQRRKTVSLWRQSAAEHSHRLVQMNPGAIPTDSRDDDPRADAGHRCNEVRPGNDQRLDAEAGHRPVTRQWEPRRVERFRTGHPGGRGSSQWELP